MRFFVQLTIGMIIAVVLAVAAVGYFSFTFAKDALITEIGREQQEQARETLSIIDRTLYHNYQEIQVIADANPIEDVFISGDFTSGAQQRVDELLLQTGPWDDLELFSLEGEMVSHSEQNQEKHLAKHDEEGNIAFAQSAQGNVYVSDLLFSEEMGRPTMIFSAPIRNRNQAGNPVVGVVIGKISWPVILEILDGIEIKGRHIHLFNKDGMTIATPTHHKSEILQHDLRHNSIVYQALQGRCSSLILEEEPYHEDDVHPEHEHISSLSSCALQQGYLGFKSKGWGLLIETSQEVIFGPVYVITRRFLFIGLVVVGLFIPLIFLLSRTITKPLSNLTTSNKLISEGKFEEAQQQQQQQRNLPTEIKELMETRTSMLKGLVGKKELDKKNNELQDKIRELEKWEKLTVGRELRIAELKKKLKELENDKK
jgi:hypothetical protein